MRKGLAVADCKLAFLPTAASFISLIRIDEEMAGVVAGFDMKLLLSAARGSEWGSES